MQAQCDVVVVGAGLLGLAAARALVRRGAEVIVLDQAQVGHAAGGSKGRCRIFRMGYPDSEYVALARRARDVFAELEDECGQQLLYPAPLVSFGPGHGAVAAAMHAAGAPCELLAAAEAAARFPDLTVGGPALVEPQACVISADAVLRALAAGIGQVRTDVEVTGISDDGRRVTVRTAEQPVTARAAVVCAGPWTSGLLAPSRITVPSAATLEQVGYLAPAADPAPALPIFLCWDRPLRYGLPVPGSPLYKIGVHNSGPVTDPRRQDHRPDGELVAQLAELARQHLPGLRHDPVQTERCVYDNSPDEDFIVDRVGNVVIGSGTSGHGFKFGPLLGEWLASLALGGDADPAAGRFTLGRFSRQPAGGGSR